MTLDIPLLRSVMRLYDEFVFLSPSTVSCTFHEHRIDAVLTERDLKLYIDNQLIERSRVYFAPEADKPLVRGNIRTKDKTHLVDVYGKSGLLKASIKICIDGQWVGGDKF